MKRFLLIPAVIVVLGAGVAGCAGFRTERQGRDVGRAICDIRQADNADEAQRALDKLNRHAQKAQRIVGRPLTEDVQDIQNNLNDLVTHATQGNDALAQQDIAVISRNVNTVSQQGPELVKRFYQGVGEGLGDCT
jgi:hypothetical protein